MARWGLCTFDGQGGSGVNPASVYILYSDYELWTNGWYSRQTASEAYRVNKTDIPIKTGYDFNGYYTTAGGKGEKVTNEKGGWNSTTMPSQNFTAYAYWTPHEYTLTFNATDGQVDPPSKSCAYNSQLGELPTPTREGYSFLGWFTEQSSGDECTASTVYAWSEDKTIFAHWKKDPVAILDARGGVVSPPEIAVKQNQPIGPLPTPIKDGFYFDGWFTQAEGGELVTEQTIFTWSVDTTFYAHWTADERFVLTFDAQGGSSPQTTKIVQPNVAVGELPTPTKYASIFVGWYDSEIGGTQWTSETVYSFHEDKTIYAHWSADPEYARTATLDANGGTVSPSSVSCVYGLPIGQLPTPTKDGFKFVGWYTSADVGGIKYGEDSVCDWSGTIALFARWAKSLLGIVEDYFGFASDCLMPISSESGDNKQRVCVYNATWKNNAQDKAGRYDAGVSDISGVWRNPSVTYAVTRSFTFQAKLGKAWAGSGSTLSGFMLTGVQIDTRVGSFPTITLTGTANEGRDAINTFDLSVPIVARSKAQNLLNAISGGGKLQACVLRAECEPVVLAENMMPCASDVVAGKLTVEATTVNIANEGEPTGANGFTSVGAPCSMSDASYKLFNIVAEKEMT